MATSPSPFFFPTTAPTYAPTAVFSPPPFGYGAPTYDHFIFPSAATYPLPFSPDGYSTPSSGSPNWPPPAAYPTTAAAYPPAFPYVVASPTQVSGFSPNWPTWPPPSPDPTSSTAPSTTTSSSHNFPVESGKYFPQPTPQIPAREIVDQSTHWPHGDGAPTGRTVMAQPCAGSSASRMQPDLTPLLKLTNNDRPILTEVEPVLTAPNAQQNIPSKVSNTSLFPGTDLFGTISPAHSLSLAVPTTTSASTMTMPTAPACVAPKVLGEMPTPLTPFSGQGTRDIARNFCSGHHKLIQRSCLSNLSEQNLDETPQSYGFHNLNRQNLFLADGTEQSYFTLPADYPLERDVPEPLFAVYDDESDGYSTESVPVLIDPPGQQTYEEEQRGNEQPTKCFSKPVLSLARPSVGAFSEHAADFTSTHVPHFIVEDSSGMTNTDAKLNSWPGSELDKTVGQAATQLWNKLLTEAGRKEWDPGDTKYHALFKTAVSATELRCTNVYKSAMVQILAVQFGARRAPFFESAIMCYFVVGSTWTEVNATAALVLAIPCAKGTHYLFMSNSGSSRTNYVFPKLFMQSLWATPAVQVSKQNNSLDFLSMAEMLLNGSEFRDGQLAYITQGTNVGSSELAFPGSSASEWLPFCSQNMSVYCESDIVPHQVQLVHRFRYHGAYVWDHGTILLHWLLLLREEKEKVTLVHEQWIFGFSAMQYCQIIEKCCPRSHLMYWHHDIKFSGIAVWLITFNPP